MSEHFIFNALRHPDGCVLDRYPERMKPIWQPTEGVRVGALYPQPHAFEMSRRMGGKAIFDCIENTLGYLIVSEPVRRVLEAHATAEIEFLPIHLVNHKGRQESRCFFIANVLGRVDCVDLRQSRYEESALRPGEFCELTKLVLDPQRIDPLRNIFRIAHLPRVIVVTAALADALRQSGATGLSFLPPGTETSL